jgi:hypothetical protein
MATEDHDFEEINYNFKGKKIQMEQRVLVLLEDCLPMV